MDWSDQMVLEFLHNYETEPIIWDLKHPQHRKKHLLADAWHRILSNISFAKSVEELKKKKDSLMAYYRIHLNKMKNPKISETGDEEPYTTSWFAFSTMHSFLGPVYEMSLPMETEQNTDDDESSGFSPSCHMRSVDSASLNRKRPLAILETPVSKKRIDEAYLRDRVPITKPEKGNECDLFGQLLAEKLKKLNEERRIVLMHNIDNLVFREIMAAKAEERAETIRSYSASSSPSDYVFVKTETTDLSINSYTE